MGTTIFNMAGFGANTALQNCSFLAINQPDTPIEICSLNANGTLNRFQTSWGYRMLSTPNGSAGNTGAYLSDYSSSMLAIMGDLWTDLAQRRGTAPNKYMGFVNDPLGILTGTAV